MDEFDGSNGRWRIESVIHQAIAKFRNQPEADLPHSRLSSGCGQSKGCDLLALNGKKRKALPSRTCGSAP